MFMLRRILPVPGLWVALALHAAAPQPNVLVILTDDQRWDALGVVQRELGDQALFPWFQTPHLDRLAAEGARFANAFVTTSLCSPSRASLLSGRYARRHQVLNNFTEYPNDLPGYPRRAARQPVTKRPTSANGTWARTTTRSGPASTSG